MRSVPKKLAHLSPLTQLFVGDSSSVPTENRPVVEAVRNTSRHSANDAARKDVAVVVPVVDRPRKRDPSGEQRRREAKEELQCLLATSYHRISAVEGTEARASQ